MSATLDTANRITSTYNKKQIANMARRAGWRGDDARTPILQLALFVAQHLEATGKDFASLAGDGAESDNPFSGPAGEAAKDAGGSAKGTAAGAAEAAQDAASKAEAAKAAHDAAKAAAEAASKAGGEATKGLAESRDSKAAAEAAKKQAEAALAAGDFAEAAAKAGEAAQAAQKAAQAERDAAAKIEAAKAANDAAEAAAKAAQKAQQDAYEAQQKAAQAEADKAAAEAAKAEADKAEGDAPSWPDVPMPKLPEDAPAPAVPPVNPFDAEFAALLKASNIAEPHRLLKKVWLLSAKAKQNVLMVGPAGSGKTTLAMQLSQLLGVPFASVSTTEGMSESALTGWLLPMKDRAGFDYVPSPFVDSIQSASVFLIDEMDRGDANVMMVLQSLLANGFISIPHKVDAPKVLRSPECNLVAGVNALNGYGSEVYSESKPLDGAFVDRWYPIPVDYDAAYIKSIFKPEGKAKPKAAAWKGAMPADDAAIEAAGDWFHKLQAATDKAKLSKIVGPRFAHKLVAALRVGIPFDEVKHDLMLDWSKDEMQRVGEGR